MNEAVTEAPLAATPEMQEQYAEAVAPNFPLAVAAGAGAAVVGAILWAVVGYVTNMELGLVAIAVGALVGIAVQGAGKGSDQRFAFIGAAFAALGWALGTVLCDVAFLAKATGQPLLDVVTRVGISDSVALAIRASDAMDLLFLAIAVWEGYKFSIRRR